MALNSINPNLPAITPPPGVQSNFIDPPSQVKGIIILEAIFIPLMLLAVSARIWVRTRIVKIWGADDTTCILAACGSIAHMIVYTQTFPLGFGRHLWDIRAITLVDPSADRTLSANGIAYPWTVCFAKLSILLFYKRIFGVYRTMQIAIWVGIFIDVVLYTAFGGLAIGSMIKCTGLAQVNDPFCVYNEGINVLLTSMVNVITDFYVLLLPIPRLIQLQLNYHRKIGLFLVFASGLGACATSLARLINFSINIRSHDVLWVQGINAQFTVVEMNIAIGVACASCFPPFFAHISSLSSSLYRSVWTRLFTTRSVSHPSVEEERSIGSKPSQDKYYGDQQPLQREESYKLQLGTKINDVREIAPSPISLGHESERSDISQELSLA